MTRSIDRLLAEASHALVLGVGGGGDVVGALATARLCRSFGTKASLGGLAWERPEIDPEPGPRPLDSLVDVELLGRNAALAGPRTRSRRGILLAESRVAGFLGERTVLIEVSNGSVGAAEGVALAADMLEADLVVMIDSGGDILATGVEPGLRSPLCDAVMLAAGEAVADRLNAVAGVFAPGCDGELTPSEVMSQISAVARGGGWLGAWGLTPGDVDELDRAAALVPTEVTLQALACARGAEGRTTIRSGSRQVSLGPLGALTFYFDPVIAIRAAAPLATCVRGTTTLEDANEALHAAGVETELDFKKRNETTRI